MSFFFCQRRQDVTIFGVYISCWVHFYLCIPRGKLLCLSAPSPAVMILHMLLRSSSDLLQRTNWIRPWLIVSRRCSIQFPGDSIIARPQVPWGLRVPCDPRAFLKAHGVQQNCACVQGWKLCFNAIRKVWSKDLEFWHSSGLNVWFSGQSLKPRPWALSRICKLSLQGSTVNPIIFHSFWWNLTFWYLCGTKDLTANTMHDLPRARTQFFIQWSAHREDKKVHSYCPKEPFMDIWPK